MRPLCAGLATVVLPVSNLSPFLGSRIRTALRAFAVFPALVSHHLGAAISNRRVEAIVAHRNQGMRISNICISNICTCPSSCHSTRFFCAMLRSTFNAQYTRMRETRTAIYFHLSHLLINGLAPYPQPGSNDLMKA